MDSWQRAHITGNLPELVELTICNAKLKTILLSARVLSNVDLGKLQATKERDGPEEEAMLLYQFLVTRKNAYKAIGEATFKTQQSGAFCILLRGLIQHLFTESNICLADKFLDDILNAECQEEDALDFYSRNVETSSLYQCIWGAPPPNPLYIPRYLSNRVRFDPKKLKQKCLDVFVFTGITRSELTNLAQPYGTALSGTVILEKKTRARFILLDHEQDWENITACLNQPSSSKARPVHLIQFDSSSNQCVLLESTQRSELLSRHGQPQLRDKSLYVSEEEFLDKFFPAPFGQAICICDTPGMGKSWLLESIASKLQQQSRECIVAVISLSELGHHCSKSGEKDVFSSEMNILLGYLCPFRVMARVLEEAFRQGGVSLELFLDGFDEVSQLHMQSIKRIFGNVTKTQENVRLFVTSRPHMREELEQTFLATAYDILPFSEENQIEYLVRFWRQADKQLETADEDKIRTFAVACLEKLKKSLTKEEGDLMGVPLQCFIVASANLTNVKLYCRRKKDAKATEFISVTSMYDMYSKYWEMGLDKAIRNDSLNETQNGNQKKRQFLQSFHVWKALELLFPELAEDYFQATNLSERDPPPEIFACGLLQISATNATDQPSVKFLHRTFAEFLVAELFAKIVVGSQNFSQDELLPRFMGAFVQDILQVEYDHGFPEDRHLELDLVKMSTFSFRNRAIMCFLDASLNHHDFEATHISVARHFIRSVKPPAFSAILSGCISSRHGSVVRLLKSVLSQGMEDAMKDKTRELLGYSAHMVSSDNCTLNGHGLSSFAYLCIAAKYANVAVVEELYNLFQECLEEDLNDSCASMPMDVITPLHYAAEQRDYSLVEFFAGRIYPLQRSLLSYCVEDTNVCTTDEVLRTIEICKFLVGKCESMLDEVAFGGTASSAILAPFVHVEVIKFLVLAGADIQQTTRGGSNLVSWHATCMEKQEFTELCRFLILDVKSLDLFRPQKQKWEDPLPELLCKIDAITLTHIIDHVQPNVHSLNEKGNNLIFTAILDNGHVDVIQVLVQRNVNLHARNNNGESALHLVAQTGNVELAKYLLHQGVSLEDTDDRGNTPLHAAVFSWEMVRYLESEKINLHAVNKEGNNIAHLAAKLDYCSEGNDDVMDYLLTKKTLQALFRTRNLEGKTPTEILFEREVFPKILNIEDLLKILGVEVPPVNAEGLNVFLLAVENEQSMKVLQLLISKGADPFSVNRSKQGALHLAVAAGNRKIVEYLVSLRLPLEGRDEDGNTPLLLSVKNVEVAKYLVSQSAHALATDAGGNNMAHKFQGVIDFLAGSFSGQAYRTLFKAANQDGRTPLHEWIAEGAVIKPGTIMQVMQCSGVDVNAGDTSGRNMFLSAVAKNYGKEILNCLMELGSDPLTVDNASQNALHLSVHGDLLLQRYLVSLGVPWDTPDIRGNTPLHLAAKERKLELMKYFLFQNANVLARNRNGENIAHLALQKIVPMELTDMENLKQTIRDTEKVSPTVFYILHLPEGAALFNMVDNKGRSPLYTWVDNAADSWWPSIEQFEEILIKSGLDVNQPDVEGHSLFLAGVKTVNYNLRVLRCLHKRGADPNLSDIHGDNALHLSLRSQNWVVEDLAIKWKGEKLHKSCSMDRIMFIAGAFNKQCKCALNG